MLMIIVLLHVTIALTSVIWATYSLVHPSLRKLIANYSLIGLTLASGTYLVLSSGHAVLSSCIMGLAYTLVMTGLTIAARVRMTKLAITTER